ncbi:MAG: hypothetical protein Kow0042_22810 [Calditrichia bacterium]
MEVSTQHKFEDEWLLKALLDYQIVTWDFAEELRGRYADQDYVFDVLVQNNHLTAEDIAVFVESILQIPYVNLEEMEVNSAAIEQVPESLAQKYKVFAFNLKDDHIAVAFANPFDLDAEKEIAYVSGKFVKTFYAFKDQIQSKIEEYYSPDKFIDNLVDRANIDKAVQIAGEKDTNAPVVKLVSLIIGNAIEEEASDIHIEPKEKMVVVRYRVDGILRNILEVPKSVQASLVSRIKIMSNLNIAESRKPQDGKAKVVHDNTPIDLRISVLPTNFGEKVVIRILDNRKAKVSFQQLGLHEENLAKLEQCFTKTQGMILVTGPTGSGKTTTLYAALNRIRNTTNNILTIEDPIEYMIEGINQVQVNEKAGVTFASALRSFLRQDPDVILVGEIRDQETAEIAIQAALTGHLVLSTLHTNDSLATITRLVDMGIDIYKIASSLEAVIAQRLVRSLCPGCKKEAQPDEIEKKLIPFISKMGLEPRFYRSDGCPHCGFSGYKGRVGVYEILLFTDDLKDLVATGASVAQIRKAARKQGFQNLYEDALRHIAAGLTDYKEVMRVINPGNVGGNGSSEETAAESMVSTVLDSAGDASQTSLKTVAQPPPKEPGLSGEESIPPSENAAKSQQPTILLVEDSPGMRKMVRVLVEKRTDWKLLEAEDGRKALEIISKVRPDVVVMDIMMPNMNGYELLQYMRNNLSTAVIPVLVLTALNGAENEVKSFDLGADDYLSKPYNPHVLLARIKRLLLRSNHRQFKNDDKRQETKVHTLKLV